MYNYKLKGLNSWSDFLEISKRKKDIQRSGTRPHDRILVLIITLLYYIQQHVSSNSSSSNYSALLTVKKLCHKWRLLLEMASVFHTCKSGSNYQWVIKEPAQTDFLSHLCKSNWNDRCLGLKWRERANCNGFLFCCCCSKSTMISFKWATAKAAGTWLSPSGTISWCTIGICLEHTQPSPVHSPLEQISKEAFQSHQVRLWPPGGFEVQPPHPDSCCWSQCPPKDPRLSKLTAKCELFCNKMERLRFLLDRNFLSGTEWTTLQTRSTFSTNALVEATRTDSTSAFYRRMNICQDLSDTLPGPKKKVATPKKRVIHSNISLGRL